MCNINYPKFPCRICAKNVHEKDKAVQRDLCELCYITDIYKTVMNPGIAWNIAAQFFLSTV